MYYSRFETDDGWEDMMSKAMEGFGDFMKIKQKN
jgi:hypothetical protein